MLTQKSSPAIIYIHTYTRMQAFKAVVNVDIFQLTLLSFPPLHSLSFSNFRMKNFETNDLAFSSEKGYGENSGLSVYVTEAIDPSINWDDLKWLRGLTALPIVAKGILRGWFACLKFYNI